MSGGHYISHATHRMLELEGMELASFGRRAGAFVLDFLFMALVATFGTLVVAKLALWLGWKLDDIKLVFNFTNWYSLVSIVVYFGLATYLGKGQTLAKRLLRIRVVSTVHPQLGLWHSLERALGYGASALELGFGFLQYFIAENRQTVHDRIAETIVVSVPKRPRKR